MKKKGQAVFIAAILAVFLVITYFLVFPIVADVFSVAKQNLNMPFVSLLIDIIPFFLGIMIIWVILKVARSE